MVTCSIYFQILILAEATRLFKMHMLIARCFFCCLFLLQVWDYQTKSCVQTLEGHSHNVSAVCFHPELPIILTGSEDGTVRIWHATTYRWAFSCQDFVLSEHSTFRIIRMIVCQYNVLLS